MINTSQPQEQAGALNSHIYDSPSSPRPLNETNGEYVFVDVIVIGHNLNHMGRTKVSIDIGCFLQCHRLSLDVPIIWAALCNLLRANTGSGLHDVREPNETCIFRHR